MKKNAEMCIAVKTKNEKSISGTSKKYRQGKAEQKEGLHYYH